MPWPAGEPNRCVLVEETRWPIEAATRRPADRRPRPRDLRQPRGAPRRDLARARPRRPRHLHRAEPLRPLGAARRHALRLRPPLQPRPARERCCAPTASCPSATPPPSTRRRRTASSCCRPPISGSASAAASSRASSPAPCSSRPPSRSTPARPPPGSRVAVPGPLDVLEGLTRPKPEPVRGHGRRALARPAR